MTVADRPDRVLGLIEELADGGVRPPDTGMRLVDAGIDSLAFAELAVALEREIGADLARVDVRPDDRISDVVRAVEAASPPAEAELPRGIGSLQRGSRVVGEWALRWWFDLRVSGIEHVPRAGARPDCDGRLPRCTGS